MTTQLSHPYLSAATIEVLMSNLRPPSLSETRELQLRLSSCAWIYMIGKELQFPLRTTGTAMMIYHRFHLSNAIAEFSAQDICAACLFVASKMEDTSKKAKDILVVSHAQRSPQSPDIDPDSVMMEEQRRRVMGLERMILESCAFDFRHRHSQTFLIKFARTYNVSRDLTRLAWNISLDAYRTWLPLQLPPHVIALACIVLAARVKTIDLHVEPVKLEVSHIDLQFALEGLLDLYLHAKGFVMIADVGEEEGLMEIKSTLLRSNTSDNVQGNRHKSNGKRAIIHNLTSLGDRATCRFLLDPDRVER